VTDATGYEIMVNGSVSPGTFTGTTATIENLSADTEYTFRIRAYIGNEHGEWSASLTIKTEAPSDTPFDVTVTDNSTTIDWSESSLPVGTVGFQYKESASGTWVTWATVTASDSSITFLGLKANTAYDFRFVDAEGNQIGDVMQKATIADSGTSALNPVKPKVAVIKKGTDAPTITSVTLTWDALPKKATAESNVVYISTCTTPNSGITPVAVSGTGKLSHTFTGLNPGTSYKFTITATNADGKTIDIKGKDATVKITAKTLKYAAVKKVGTIGKPSPGTVTFGWKDANKMPTGEGVTYEVGIYNAKTKKYLWGDAAVAFAPEVAGFGLTADGGTTKTVTLTGLLSQKYTFAVKAIATNNGVTLESAVTKFAVAPLAYKAPKFAQPAKLDGNIGAVTLNLKAASVTILPAGYTTGNYEVGVLIGGKYVWGDAASEYLTGGLTSTATVGEDWAITGTDKLKKGLKIAVRVVVYDPTDSTIVATKSAMQKITVK
jgi:hypothetical protein